MTRPSPATVRARRVTVRFDGERVTREMWVKPWSAEPGTQVDYRGLGSDWPWHHGVLVTRHDRMYVIQAAA